MKTTLILVCTGLLCACAGDIGLERTPLLSLTPEQIVVPAVAPDKRVERSLRVENLGTGPLKIVDLRVSLEDYGLRWGFSPEAGNTVFPRLIEVPAGAPLYLVLDYVGGSGEGAITMRTNDPDQPEVEIPILARGATVEPRFSPASQDFGLVPMGDFALREVTLSNVGTLPAFVGGSTLPPESGFRLCAPMPAVIEPGDAHAICLRFDPRRPGPARSTLSVEIDELTYSIDLSANAGAPCVALSPESLEFPSTLIGRESTKRISVQSCGELPLQIDALRIEPEGAFSLDFEGGIELPAAVPGEAPPSVEVPVVFSPLDGEISAATLFVGEVEVPLLGRGVENECPDPRSVLDRVEALPLDVITLDGSPSVDPDGLNGRPVGYVWSVAEAPEGSLSRVVESFWNAGSPADGGPDDDPSTPEAFFFVDLAGEYRFELRVVDALGADCGRVAELVGEARPRGGIHLQLTWDTPGDPDQTDSTGTDVDLHLRHPDGRDWATAPLDCYYANVSPDWGPAGPAGNPSLDIDDTNGGGPENINLETPEDTQLLGAPYLIGVHYYRSEDFLGGGVWGPSRATVRVYIDSVLTAEFEHVLQRRDEFWEVAAIHWTEHEVRVEPL